MATPKQPPRAPAAAPRAPAAAERSVGMLASPAPQQNALALAPSIDNDALAALQAAGINVEDDTSGVELTASDFKTPVKMYNIKSKGADGSPRRQDRFYDSITGEEQESIDFSILALHKSNFYGVYDSGEGRTNRICSSFDQVTGVWAEDGHTRQCKGCPDQRAVKQPDGKVRSNCCEIVDVSAVELDNARLFQLRGKRTSRPPIMNHMHMHHYGKGGMHNGKRAVLPLYTYRVTARLEMDASGNYAHLILEKGDMFSPNDLKVLHESSLAIRETLAERLAEVDAQVNAVEGDAAGGGDDSFAYGANAGAEPQKFVNAP